MTKLISKYLSWVDKNKEAIFETGLNIFINAIQKVVACGDAG